MDSVMLLCYFWCSRDLSSDRILEYSVPLKLRQVLRVMWIEEVIAYTGLEILQKHKKPLFNEDANS